MEPMSAFSMYAIKRKSIEQLLSSKKKRRTHSRENEAIDQKIPTQKTVKKIDEQQLKRKCTLNTALKTKQGIATKTGNLKIFKKNFPVAKKERYFHKKSKIDETRQLNEINNVQSINKNTKLKKKILKTKSKINKVENVKSFNKKKLKKSQVENHLPNQDNDNLNDTNDEKDMKCDDSDNPIVSGQKLFEWLIYPLNVDDFFQ